MDLRFTGTSILFQCMNLLTARQIVTLSLQKRVTRFDHLYFILRIKLCSHET